MERDGALDDVAALFEGDVQEMGVELQVHGRVQVRHQLAQRHVAAELVSRADVRDRGPAQVLGLQHLSHEQVAVIHERAELRRVGAQALHRAGSVDDVGVGGVGQQLVQVVGPERAITLAEHKKLVVPCDHLFEATIDAAAVALPFLVQGRGARFSRAVQRGVTAVVADNDDFLHERMVAEVAHRFADAVLVVIGRQCDHDPGAADRIIPHPNVGGALLPEQDEQIHQGEGQAEDDRNAAVPDDPTQKKRLQSLKIRVSAVQIRPEPPQAERRIKRCAFLLVVCQLCADLLKCAVIEKEFALPFMWTEA